MAFRVAQSVAALGCDAMVDAIDAGSATSKLQIMSGSIPATISTALGSQQILAEFALPDPAFGSAAPTSGGATATANAIAATTALAAAGAGTLATWFRVIDGNGTVIMDGSVTDTEGAGPMKLANQTIVQGIDVTIVSWTAFHPV